jgi:hypothetical protein
MIGKSLLALSIAAFALSGSAYAFTTTNELAWHAPANTLAAKVRCTEYDSQNQVCVYNRLVSPYTTPEDTVQPPYGLNQQNLALSTLGNMPEHGIATPRDPDGNEADQFSNINPTLNPLPNGKFLVTYSDPWKNSRLMSLIITP